MKKPRPKCSGPRLEVEDKEQIQNQQYAASTEWEMEPRFFFFFIFRSLVFIIPLKSIMIIKC